MQCAWSRVRTKSDRKARSQHEIQTWICHWCPALIQLATGHEHNGWIPYVAKRGAGFSWSSLVASYSSPTLFRSWIQTSTPLLSKPYRKTDCQNIRMPEFQYRNHLRPARRSALRPLQEFVRGGLGLRMARECQPAGPVAADRASWNNRL